MDDEFMININFKEGKISTNREPRTEEEKIRLKLIEQEETIRRYEHFIGEATDPDVEHQACPPQPKGENKINIMTDMMRIITDNAQETEVRIPMELAVKIVFELEKVNKIRSVLQEGK